VKERGDKGINDYTPEYNQTTQQQQNVLSRTSSASVLNLFMPSNWSAMPLANQRILPFLSFGEGERVERRGESREKREGEERKSNFLILE